MSDRTAYQKAITAAIAAAGHAVEWKPLHPASPHVLHIDGAPCGSNLTGDRPEVAGVWGSRGSEWAKRRLSADPCKAAATLIDRHAAVIAERDDRHAAVIAERERTAAQNRRDDARQEHRLAIEAAIGDVPARLSVEVHPAAVVLSLRLPSLTPEQAARLGDAIRGALAPTRDLQADPVTDDEGGPW